MNQHVAMSRYGAAAAFVIATVGCTQSQPPHPAASAERTSRAAAALSSAQQSAGCEGTPCDMTTSSVAFLSPQTAGDLNVVVMGWSDPNRSVTSVTDSAGNSYTLAAGPTTTDGYWVESTYYASNIVGSASNTVSVVLSGAADVEVRVLEYSGVATSSPLDAVLAASAGTGPAQTGPLTTTASNDLLVVPALVTGCFTAPSDGYSERLDTGCDLVEDTIAATPGAYTAAVQHDNTGSWVQQMVAFLAGPAQVPAFVQANGYDDEGPSAARYQIALSSAEAQGDLNLIAIGWSDSTTTVASVTDTAGNNYVAATPVTSVSGVWSQQLFYAANIGAVLGRDSGRLHRARLCGATGRGVLGARSHESDRRGRRRSIRRRRCLDEPHDDVHGRHARRRRFAG